MKTTVPQQHARRLPIITGIAVALLLITPGGSSTAAPVSGAHSLQLDACADTIHSIQINKFQSSKKNKIRLYPDAKQQVLFFSANGEDRKVYQLYLFDMDGRLINQASIRNKETTVLTNMEQGNYLFEVFTDDERIENGHLSVR